MNELVNNILDYIDTNLDNEINIDTLSNVFNYDKFYIMKLFKRELGISIVTYINFIKVLNSLNYYECDESILKIALSNGFNSLEYYSEVFKSFLGVSPTIYKKYISGDEVNVEDVILLRNSIMGISKYKTFISNYRNGIKLEEDKGICLTLYNKQNKKAVA
jgi:AraC-like DNA-binding protein